MSNIPYLLNEGQLTLPEQWLDQSMNMFVIPNSGINLVINRVKTPIGMSDEDYYQQVIEQFRHNLKDYQELNFETVELSQQPAYLLEYQWKTPEGVMYQSTFLQIRHQTLITFTYTNTTPFSKSQRESLFNIIYSFQARKIE